MRRRRRRRRRSGFFIWATCSDPPFAVSPPVSLRYLELTPNAQALVSL